MCTVTRTTGNALRVFEAWAFVQWKWGPEESIVSDLRKVMGCESVDAEPMAGFHMGCF